MYYCINAFLYDTGDWKTTYTGYQLGPTLFLYLCTSVLMHYSTTQGIGKQLTLEINSASLVLMYYCTDALLYDTRA